MIVLSYCLHHKKLGSNPAVSTSLHPSHLLSMKQIQGFTNLVTDRSVDVLEWIHPDSSGLEKVVACPVQRMAVLPSAMPGVRTMAGERLRR